MTDDDFFDATAELTTVYQWARARFAAPWAVFGAVLLRVAASTGPEVQLPGIIGGRASLNLLAAFVSPSGGGKGISDKVARLAWPTPIIERPIGSGEGIAALFAPPKKEGAERITRAILNVTEIDTLAGIASRQGSILLAQLKAMAMGELLGQSNASEATSRVVQPHTYRCCLSVGAQPGHTGVVFNDTSGGTPQRFLWFPTIDPDMPATAAPDPEPLNTNLPAWARLSTDVVEIQYGPDEITRTVIEAHISRQRGDADALDGHAVLTRLKVAGVLAVLHHRMVVSELDWQLSGQVMAMSDRTREWILAETQRAARAKIRDRAMSRVVGEEFIDQRRHEVVKRRVQKILGDGPATYGDLNRRVGKKEYRELLGSAIADLLNLGAITSEELTRGTRYALTAEFNVEPEFNHDIARSDGLNPEFNVEPQATVTDLDTRRSQDDEPEVLSCQQWFNRWIADLQHAGHTTTTSFAAHQAGATLGYRKGNIRAAVSSHPDVHTIDRKGGHATWSIKPGFKPSEYQSAAQWLDSFIDSQDADTIDPDTAKTAGAAAGHPWHSVRRAAGLSPRIESIPAHGEAKNERLWRIITTSGEETA